MEKHVLTGERIFENALKQLLAGQESVDEAKNYIMDFARGHSSLVVDEA